MISHGLLFQRFVVICRHLVILIRFVYDNSIDSDDQNGLTPRLKPFSKGGEFYEVISLNKKEFYLGARPRTAR